MVFTPKQLFSVMRLGEFFTGFWSDLEPRPLACGI
jgi:hypothetical protein